MMKNKFYSYRKLMFLLAVALITGACSEFKDKTNYDDAIESVKDLSGTWKILKATRNGQDITNMMDFSQFRLNLESDGAYTIDHYLPFLVQNNGQWAVDDPQFPFKLIFTESGAAAPLTSELYYPVVEGKRQINLTFSPGCHSNSYTYVFVSE